MANSCDQQPQLISALVSLVAPSAALISITSHRSFGETFLTQSINEAKNSSISKPSNYISFSFAPSLPLTPQHLISLHFTWAKPGSARVGWSRLEWARLHFTSPGSRAHLRFARQRANWLAPLRVCLSNSRPQLTRLDSRSEYAERIESEQKERRRLAWRAQVKPLEWPATRVDLLGHTNFSHPNAWSDHSDPSVSVRRVDNWSQEYSLLDRHLAGRWKPSRRNKWTRADPPLEWLARGESNSSVFSLTLSVIYRPCSAPTRLSVLPPPPFGRGRSSYDIIMRHS